MILEVQHWCSVVLHFESPAIQKYLARKYRFVSPPKLTLNIYEVYVPGIYIVQKITPGITIPLPTTAVDFVTNFTEKKHTHTKGDSGENGVIAVLSSQMVEQLHQPEYIYMSKTCCLYDSTLVSLVLTHHQKPDTHIWFETRKTVQAGILVSDWVRSTRYTDNFSSTTPEFLCFLQISACLFYSARFIIILLINNR